MNRCIALKIAVANRLRVTLPLASRTEVRSALSAHMLLLGRLLGGFQSFTYYN